LGAVDGDFHLHAADAGELGDSNVAGTQWELAYERPGHDDVARTELSPVLAELVDEPSDGIQRIPEYRGTQAGCHLLAVELNARRNLVQRHRWHQANRRADHGGALLPIVGQRHCNLLYEVAARLDDLERWVDDVDCGANPLLCDGAFKGAAKPHTKLGLKAGVDQLGSAEHVSARFSFQDAREHGLMKAELLLDDLRG
jgi:hypothetical protein